MKTSLVVEPAAEEDIFHGYLWYEERHLGLVLRFLIALESLFSKILERPKLYPEALPGIRRSVTRTFPYLVFYTIETSSIHILAVIHAAQNPNYISARLGT